jgi:hypothetical protein
MKDFYIVIVGPTLHMFDVDGNCVLIAGIDSTCVQYDYDIHPFDIMSLPSSLCFDICTSW